MSISITTDLFCDQCSHWQPGCTRRAAASREVLAAARQVGWTITRGKHLCPACNGTKPDFWRLHGSYNLASN